MKLEPGKYYMTRNGRKVGPMEFNPVEGFLPWEDREYGDLWDDDGTSDSGENDIIAEWNTVIKAIEGFENTDPIPSSAFDPYAPITSMAALAAQHRIKITAHVGEVVIEYDGRE